MNGNNGTEFVTIILPLMIAFLVSAVSGKFVIPYLRKVKAGQTERTDGPQSHLKKTGTPNMGGIMILLGLAAASLCMAPRCPEVIPVLILRSSRRNRTASASSRSSRCRS